MRRQHINGWTTPDRIVAQKYRQQQWYVRQHLNAANEVVRNVQAIIKDSPSLISALKHTQGMQTKRHYRLDIQILGNGKGQKYRQ